MSDEKKDASKVCSTCGKVENPVCSNSFHLPAYQSALQSPAVPTMGEQADAMDAAQRYVEERDFISNDSRRIAGEAFLAGRRSVSRPATSGGKDGT